MSLLRSQKDSLVLIGSDGSRTEFRGGCVGDLITTMDTAIHLEPGDQVERKLPNGHAEIFDVIDPCFYNVGSMGPHWQIKVAKKGTQRPAAINKINITGDGARIYQDSTDNSTNTVFVGGVQIFNEVSRLIEKHASGDQRNLLAEKVEELKNAKDQKTGVAKFAEFSSIAASVATVWSAVAPYCPQLLEFIHKLPL